MARQHRAPLLWLILPYCAGLIASRWNPSLPRSVALDIGLVAALAAITATFGSSNAARRCWAAGLLLTLTCTGYTVGSDSEAKRHAALIRSLTSGNHPMAVQILHLGSPRTQGPNWRSLSGLGRQITPEAPLIAFRLLLRPGENPPVPGTAVELSGNVQRVSSRGGPDTYAGYLRSQNVAFELAPAWLRRELTPADPAAPRSEQLARQMSASLSQGLSAWPELAAVYQAMMLGRKAGLTPAQRTLFSASGTQHLFAINGLHLGIVALSLHALLKLLRCPALIASLVVLAVLWLDVQSTGASPSALRAWLMTAAVETAHACWLPINPLAALSVALAVLIAGDSTALFSASLQMSCGVVAGLILLGVPYSRWLQRRYAPYPHSAALRLNGFQRARAAVQHHVLGAFGFGVAAAAVSAVTGVEYFGRFAPSGLLANLVVMPLATLVIVAGCAAILAGLLHFSILTLVFNSAARLLLQAIVALLQLIVQLPGAAWTLHYRAAWIGPLALTALLAACLRGYSQRWRRENGGWAPPFLVAAAALLLGARFGS